MILTLWRTPWRTPLRLALLASRPTLVAPLLALVATLLATWMPASAQTAPRPATAPTAPAALPGFGPLVSAEWLKAHLGRAELLLIDASPAPLHARQHIPGAVNVDLFGYGPREAPPAVVEQRFQAWGLSPGRKVVVYDPGASYLAPRIYFDLIYRGVPAADVAVLDGGLARWMAVGGSVTTEPTPAPARGSFRLPAPREELRVRLDEFLHATGRPQTHAVVEALETEMHYGAIGFFDRPGHVPHAISWPTQELFNPDKTFKAPEELRRMALHVGIRPEMTVLTHCGGGIAAAGPFFVLKALLNYPNVKLYHESQLEWLADPRGLPFWTYGAPMLLRDAAWVKGWGAGMMREFGITEVSLIDVRAPEVHALGHLPWSVNVPAEGLAAQLNNPSALAERLSAAGVNRAHEAVIVGEGGLTPQAALAFVALERLGQARTSLLLDSTERWAELGHEVTREPTRVGARKAAGEKVVAPVRYTPAPAPPARAALYPRVYLASGAQPLARPPEGARTIHLPYTQLLGSDGRPKPAKDIWAALQKAGVPRYAEVVTVADAPGDAAAAYVLLKLMGWPDVKAGL